MKLETIIAMASSAYPDDLIQQIYKAKTTTQKDALGDGLAKFIASELSETYDKKAPLEKQLYEACNAMDRVAREVHAVREILQDYRDIAILEADQLPLRINDENPFVQAILKERLKS